jgi:hypothetical protein
MLDHDKSRVVMNNTSENIFQNLPNYNITIGDWILLLVSKNNMQGFVKEWSSFIFQLVL